MSDVVVYGRENCIQCRYTTREMDRIGLDYIKVDIDKDEEARVAVEAYGPKTLPVVVSGQGTWFGFSPDKIRALRTPVIA